MIYETKSGDEKIGIFANTDRLLLLHVDDIGMCNAGMDAYRELYDFGLISCGSVMVPCPYFLSAAGFAKDHPKADLGIHITLTSEWLTYRWKPLSTVDPDFGVNRIQRGIFHGLLMRFRKNATLRQPWWKCRPRWIGRCGLG